MYQYKYLPYRRGAFTNYLYRQNLGIKNTVWQRVTFHILQYYLITLLARLLCCIHL